jgi:hypothetical protein
MDRLASTRLSGDRSRRSQNAGIGVTPTSSDVGSVFRIDHDEVFNSTFHLQYQPKATLPWYLLELALR